MENVISLDLSTDSKENPEISQLLRIIMHADSFIVAEGSDVGIPYVIISGAQEEFIFTKTDEGYFMKKMILPSYLRTHPIV